MQFEQITYEVKGKGEGGNTAKKVVGGAGLGASRSSSTSNSALGAVMADRSEVLGVNVFMRSV